MVKITIKKVVFDGNPEPVILININIYSQKKNVKFYNYKYALLFGKVSNLRV